jgi:Domain of unknown function (DUF4157)
MRTHVAKQTQSTLATGPKTVSVRRQIPASATSAAQHDLRRGCGQQVHGPRDLWSGWAANPAAASQPHAPATVARAVSDAAAEDGHAPPPPQALDAAMQRARLRDDPAADRSARLLGAKAVTFGNEIYFRSGHLDPDSETGRALLAHEVAHVAGQAAGERPVPRCMLSGDVLSVQYTEDMAAQMSDAELEQQVTLLREHLVAEPDDQGAAENLRALEQSVSTRQGTPKTAAAKSEALKINGTIVAGGPLSAGTISAVNAAAIKTPAQWRRFVAYADVVKVGGSLAWRANNPGNLRDASTKIGTVSGAVGKFAVFATLDDGRAAQRALYLSTYGDRKVRDAINRLTPPSENDTNDYLAKLARAGVDLDKDVKSQIDALMVAVEANEGLITGTEIQRVP